MRFTFGRASARVALAVGVVAGGWLIPMKSSGEMSSSTEIAAAAAPIHLAQAEGPVEAPVSYLREQADRGEERYKSDCEECHGDDLRGGLNGGPPLRGLAFEEKFADGLPASLMFAFMSAEMPPNSPGRYPASTYADLMAYILKQNGYQPGSELPADFDALDYLIMEK